MNHKQVISVKLGGEYKVLSKVPLWNSRVRVRCLKHSATFEARTDVLKRGNIGCPQCRTEKGRAGHLAVSSRPEYKAFVQDRVMKGRKTLRHHQQEIGAVHKGLKLLAIEPGHRGSFECRKCGNLWSSRIDSVKGGKGCPVCARVTMSVKKRKDPADSRVEAPGYRKSWSDIGALTKKVYRRFKPLINPDDLPWGKDYHVDHIYSVHDFWYNPKGLTQPVTQLELCHPANFQMLTAGDNIRKNKHSWISANELRKRIRVWNKLHGRPFVKRGGVLIVS